jgi:hypothetical protein
VRLTITDPVMGCWPAIPPPSYAVPASNASRPNIWTPTPSRRSSAYEQQGGDSSHLLLCNGFRHSPSLARRSSADSCGGQELLAARHAACASDRAKAEDDERAGQDVSPTYTGRS